MGQVMKDTDKGSFIYQTKKGDWGSFSGIDPMTRDQNCSEISEETAEILIKKFTQKQEQKSTLPIVTPYLQCKSLTVVKAPSKAVTLFLKGINSVKRFF